MNQQKEYSDEELIDLLKKDSEQAIDILFRRYYPFLCNSLVRVIPDRNLAEDLAQDVFFELWKKREKLNITTSVRAYLKRAATNKALNYIRDQKMKWSDADQQFGIASKNPSTLQKLEAEELQNLIDVSIEALPERCRAVFCLSRFEELSYQEIANKLEISIKTVENQISKALKMLRIAIGPHVSKGLIVLILNLFS